MEEVGERLWGWIRGAKPQSRLLANFPGDSVGYKDKCGLVLVDYFTCLQFMDRGKKEFYFAWYLKRGEFLRL